MDVHGRDLRYFVVVAEELSFTRAAERLFISQPALSKQIRMLEKQLGVGLFERDRRSVRLTPAGEALLPHARNVLEAWAGARAAIKAEQQTLVIGMSTSPGRGLLPTLRARLIEKFPDAKPVLHQVSWADPTAGLATGECDVAFVWLPMPDEHRYRYTVVAREQRLVAIPEGHPLAANESIDFADLLDEPFLALPPEAGPLRDHWLATDARNKADTGNRADRADTGNRADPGNRAYPGNNNEARIGGIIASAEEAHEAVANGEGVVLLAAGNASLIVRDGVTAVPVRGLTPSELAVACRRDDPRELVDFYLTAAAEIRLSSSM